MLLRSNPGLWEKGSGGIVIGMTTPLRLMVFTDLDGTLIDHETYTWDAAQEALEALARVPAAVILASSKTAAEMVGLRAAMGLEDWPAIVENGAGVLPPGVQTGADATHYHALRAVLDTVPPELRVQFTGFGDVTAEQVARMTGLPIADALLARQRAFSEPGQWTGTDAQQRAFEAHLKDHDVIAQQGGRFLTLSFGGNKAIRMGEIVATYQPRHTIALGDAPNDILMLEQAEHAVIVANPHRDPLPPLTTEEEGRVIRTTVAGPAGWNAAILELLQRLDLT